MAYLHETRLSGDFDYLDRKSVLTRRRTESRQVERRSEYHHGRKAARAVGVHGIMDMDAGWQPFGERHDLQAMGGKRGRWRGRSSGDRERRGSSEKVDDKKRREERARVTTTAKRMAGG